MGTFGSRRLERMFGLQVRASLELQRMAINSSGIDDSVTEAQRKRLAIQAKQARLLHLQLKLRSEILRGAQDQSLTSVVQAHRRDKRQLRPEVRLSEQLERLLQDGPEQRKRVERTKFLEAVVAAHEAFKAMHQTKKRIVQAINKDLATKEREREKRRALEADKQRKERLRLLRENNWEDYVTIVQAGKNDRIQQLLSKTEAYFREISRKVTHEREKAIQFTASSAVAAAMTAQQQQQKQEEGEGVEDPEQSKESSVKDEGGEKPASGNPSIVGRKREYYDMAHVRREETCQPKCLVGGQLKPYQLEGLKWLVSLYNNGLNGILADEMGLGKTIQTIALLCYLIEAKRNNGPFLVIVPLATLDNWKNEFAKWGPSIRVVSYRADAKSLQRIDQNELVEGAYHVVLTTYDMIVKHSSHLKKRIRWQYIIVDEGHRLKNPNSRLSRELRLFTCRYRLLLTGTPLQNGLDELWALLNFLLPTIFDSIGNFQEWFNAPFQAEHGGEKMEMNEEESLFVINQLHQVLRPFVLRREKKEVEAQLPSKTEIVIRCPLSAWQDVVYDQIQKKAVRVMDRTQKVLNNTVMQLRKVCNHPFLVNIDHDYTNLELLRSCGKFDMLDRILPKLLAAGHKILIFSQMTHLLNLLEELLEYRDIKFCRMDGSTKAEDRGGVVADFWKVTSDVHVFLLSTRAGGLGLNLQVADTVIIYDSDWNPQQDLQAQARAHRIGQTNEVHVYRFVTNTPMEEDMYQRAAHKLDLDQKVIQAGKFDRRSTDKDRREHLSAVMKKRTAMETITHIPNPTELNRIISRSEDEFKLFEKMDIEAEEHRRAEWAVVMGPKAKLRDRLMSEEELPEWLTVEEQLPETSIETLGKRKRKGGYSSELSDRQFELLIQQAEEDADSTASKRRSRGRGSKSKQTGDEEEQEQTEDGNTDAAQDNNETDGNGRDVQSSNGKDEHEEETAIENEEEEEEEEEPPPKKRRKTISQPKPTASTDWHQTAEALFDEVLKQQGGTAGVFWKLPTKSSEPYYYQIIKKPVDLKMIKAKLKKRSYPNQREFLADVRRLYQNAQEYNRDESEIFQESVELAEFINARVAELFPEEADPANDSDS
eukprot:c12293_g1_i1.p1 GENE.c12293_g1_i1~~c12293_g1_i1.p1  ORF type:complete len:1104 (-),score=304.81 c12293_g1_i1:66-3377(-)